MLSYKGDFKFLFSHISGDTMRRTWMIMIGIVTVTAIGAMCETATGGNSKKSASTSSSQLTAKKKAIYDTISVSIVRMLGVNKKSVTQKALFADDLGAASTDMADLAADWEARFGITIPESDIEALTTVQSAVDYIYEAKKPAN
jgi:acyl carrier protein